MENLEMKAVEKNEGATKNQKPVQNQGKVDNQGTVENQGTTINQETVENQGTMVKQRMLQNQGELENNGQEGCSNMSSSAINTISAEVQDPNVYDPRASVYDSRASDANRQMLIGNRREFFFLTIPGIIRVLQIFLSGLHLGCYGYFSTYYSSLKNEVTIVPFYLSAIREVFFMMVNFHTFVTTFSIILASIITVRSHTSLIGSLFMFVFDFIQFFMFVASSVSLLMLYSDEESKKVYGQSTHTRQGLSITGMLLGCLHLIGAIYDLAIYVRRLDSRIIEP